MDDNSDLTLWWAKAQGIATFVGLVAIVLQILTILYDRMVRARAADPGKLAYDEGEMGYFRVDKLSFWSAFRGFTTEKPRITTLRGLIEAGDDGLWTSAALDHLPPQHGKLSWVPLYQAVYSQLARHNDVRLADAMKNPTISRVIRRSRKGLRGTSNERHSLYDNKKLVPLVRPLDKMKDPPMENYPRREKEKGLARLANTWMLRGSPCIETTREELAALALVLGVPLKINDYTQNVSGVGPFGTGLDIIQDNGVWRLGLIHGSRLPRLVASRSSGYSVLFAKHLAFGSLPFTENKLWVRSVYIDPDVLEAIRKGYAIKDGKSFGGIPLQILRSLPAAKQIDAFYHTGNTALGEEELGCILSSNNSAVEIEINNITTVKANWCRAVVGIAFGGLVPQASKDLATAVTYTVAGEVFGYVVGDLVDALENFINKLHSCDPGANIFGDHVTERCEALQLIDYVHYATPSRYNTQEAAAVFARYMNLLERIAVLAEYRVDKIFEESCSLIYHVYVAIIMRSRRYDHASNVLNRDLVADIIHLSEKCEPHRPFKDLKLHDCTLIVWCVLIVWASRVPHGESEEFREEVSLNEKKARDFDGRDHAKNGTAKTRRPVLMTDLPQLMAFC